MTSDTTPVIVEADVLARAYTRGYKEFSDAAVDADGEAEQSISAFIESDRYTSGVLPDLRKWSGYDDTGTGTYATPQSVVVVPVGSQDDTPAEGVEVDSQHVLEEGVTDAYLSGCRDALDGSPYTSETVTHSRV
jgi:hypothetical protein